jgi:GNAT superfamily N-acetyltransferase
VLEELKASKKYDPPNMPRLDFEPDQRARVIREEPWKRKVRTITERAPQWETLSSHPSLASRKASAGAGWWSAVAAKDKPPRRFRRGVRTVLGRDLERRTHYLRRVQEGSGPAQLPIGGSTPVITADDLGAVKRVVGQGQRTNTSTEEIGAHEAAHFLNQPRRRRLRPSSPVVGMARALQRNEKVNPQGMRPNTDPDMMQAKREAAADAIASRKLGRRIVSGHLEDPGYPEARAAIEASMARSDAKKLVRQQKQRELGQRQREAARRSVGKSYGFAARIMAPPPALPSPVQKAAGGGLMLSDGSWRRDSAKRPEKRAHSRAADNEYVRRRFDAEPFVEHVPENPQHRSNDPSQAELAHRDTVARKQVEARDKAYRKRQKYLRSKGLVAKPMTRGATGRRINSPWGDAQGNTLLKKAAVPRRLMEHAGRRAAERASRVAEGALPTGSEIGPGVRVKGHEVQDGGMLWPKVKTHFEDPATGREVGEAFTLTMPGKRYMVSSMRLDPEYRGHGAGRRAQQQFVEHAKRSRDVRRAYWLAAGDSPRSHQGLSGARAWRTKGTRYARGIGQLSDAANFTEVNLTGQSRAARARYRAYVGATRAGIVRPSALQGDKVPRMLNEQTADALRNNPWVASVPGRARKPERYVAGGAAALYGGAKGAKMLKARSAAKHAQQKKKDLGTRGAAAAAAAGAGAGAGAGVLALRRGRREDGRS